MKIINWSQVTLESQTDKVGTSGDHVVQLLLKAGQLEQIAQGHVQLMLNVSKDGGSFFHLPLWAPVLDHPHSIARFSSV